MRLISLPNDKFYFSETNKVLTKKEQEYILSNLDKYHVPEEFISLYKDKISWMYVSKNIKLSEFFIKNHENYVIWNLISKYQKLSEPFIREFQGKVNWSYIFKFQKLSEKFIEKNKLRKIY